MNPDHVLIKKERPFMEDVIASIVSPDAPMTENADGGKQSDVAVRFDLIDAKALFEMAKVLDHGAKKYGADNWRLIPVQDHLNHLCMHVYAYLAGDRSDDHLSHALCRATFALGVELAEEKIEEPATPKPLLTNVLNCGIHPGFGTMDIHFSHIWDDNSGVEWNCPGWIR